MGGLAEAKNKHDNLYYPSDYYLNGMFRPGDSREEEIEKLAIFGFMVSQKGKMLSYDEAKALYEEALEEEKKKKNFEPIAMALYMAYIYCQTHIGLNVVNDGSLLYYYCTEMLQRSADAMKLPEYEDICTALLPKNSPDYLTIVKFHTTLDREITVLETYLTDVCDEHIKSGDTKKPAENKEVMENYSDLLADKFIKAKIKKQVKGEPDNRKATKLERMNDTQKNLYKKALKKEYIEKQNKQYKEAKKKNWKEFKAAVKEEPKFEEISDFPDALKLHNGFLQRSKELFAKISNRPDFKELSEALYTLITEDARIRMKYLFLDAKNCKDLSRTYKKIFDAMEKVNMPDMAELFGDNPPLDSKIYTEIINLKASAKVFDQAVESSIKEEEVDYNVNTRMSLMGGDTYDRETSYELYEKISANVDMRVEDYRTQFATLSEFAKIGKMDRKSYYESAKLVLTDMIAVLAVKESLANMKDTADEYIIKDFSCSESISENKESIERRGVLSKIVDNMKIEDLFELAKPDGNLTPNDVLNMMKKENAMQANKKVKEIEAPDKKIEVPHIDNLEPHMGP